MACVPDLIDVVGHDSGNFWVDVDEEQLGYEQVSWSEKAVRALAREWHAAQQIFRRQARAMDWLEQRPARIAQVVELWNACVSQRQGGA